MFGELYGSGIQHMEYQENLDRVRNFRVFEIFVKTNEVFRSFSLEEL